MAASSLLLLHHPPLVLRFHLPFPRLAAQRQFPVLPSRPNLPIVHSNNNRLGRTTQITLLSLSDNANPSSVKAAEEALSQVLQEFGASKEDSDVISANSQGYLGNLVAGVRELDDHGMWESWADGGEFGTFDFKRKVYLMAKRKGDGGILPFLENLGLKYSSAALVARYLATERLPDLIEKAKVIKEILFSSNSQNVLIGKNARRMLMHLSISVDEDVQRTLSFFEKMDARHGGLDMLGNEDSSFPYIIESFPHLLSRTTTNHFEEIAELLQQIGIPKSGIGNVLLLFPPMLYYSIENEIKPRIHVLQKAGVEDRYIGKMLLKYPWILSTSILENYDKLLSFFIAEKVPRQSIDLAIRSWPHLLGCSTDKIKSIVDHFKELGVNKKMLVPVITSSPQIFLRRSNEVLKVVAVLEELGLNGRTIGRILCRCPEIFCSDVENTLKKKLKFLIDFGVPKGSLGRVIRKYPELLGLDIDRTLLPRMKYLLKIGLSEREVCSMVGRFSPLLGYSIDAVLEPKLEFLLGTMQKSMKEVVEYPRYFSYSLDKKIKPRFWVLKRRNITCTLKEMLGKNDEEFAQEYMGIGKMLVVPSNHLDDG